VATLTGRGFNYDAIGNNGRLHQSSSIKTQMYEEIKAYCHVE